MKLFRLRAMFRKECIQMLRDRTTLGMIIGIPLLQLILFGYAINMNPKHLPTAVIAMDHSEYTRAFVQSLESSTYFNIIKNITDPKTANHLLANNTLSFVFHIPSDFTKRLLRHQHPQVLVAADATDPVASGIALSISQTLASQLFPSTLSKKPLAPYTPTVELIQHLKYNPERITHYNIVPALLGVVLTLVMLIITSLVITREYERGTMENLLATPARPLEVILGKMTPYILVGYTQILLILLIANTLFHVPIQGSVLQLIVLALPFISANLALGLTLSTLARNQLQAMQLAFFFFLPSLLLSGFMFPFKGMPLWAQAIGEVLPLTHFNRIVRGIILKGNGLAELWPDIWPIIAFMMAAIAISVLRYRQTLD